MNLYESITNNLKETDTLNSLLDKAHERGYNKGFDPSDREKFKEQINNLPEEQVQRLLAAYDEGKNDGDSEELSDSEHQLPSASSLEQEINNIVDAHLVEDEDGITIELLDGKFNHDSSGDITFDAPWLPVNNRPLKFTSDNEFITCLEMMTSLFSSNKK